MSEPPESSEHPTRRFTDRAADYVSYRPSYPLAARDAILEGLGPPRALVAADVGAGTGISSRFLAATGARVLAIEPNAAMREAAAPHPRIEWRPGTAEATGLRACEVDLLLSAQAFHWFAHARAMVEFHRVLRPHGRLALMWNRRDRVDPFTRGYREAIASIGAEVPAEGFELDPAVITSDGLFEAARLFETTNEQRLTREGLLGRALSASTVPKQGPRHDELMARLDALHARYVDAAGEVIMRYRTQVFLAERA